MPMFPFTFRKATLTMQQRVLAIIVGYLTAVVLTVVSLGATRVVAPEIVPDLLQGQEPGLALLITSLIFNLLAAVVAGFMTAHIARSAERKLAAALGGIMVLINILTMFMEHGAKPLWWHILLLILLVPCVVFGSSLYRPSGRKLL